MEAIDFWRREIASLRIEAKKVDLRRGWFVSEGREEGNSY